MVGATRRTTGVALVLTLLLLTACGGEQQDARPAAAPTGFVATLIDDVKPKPRGRIRWTTTWRLCWDVPPGAVGYELQTLTGEGTSPKLRRHADRCLRIEAAVNENRKSQGLFNRKLLLATISGQLAYRVRSVLEDGSRSAWSRSYAVGEAERGG